MTARAAVERGREGGFRDNQDAVMARFADAIDRHYGARVQRAEVQWTAGRDAARLLYVQLADAPLIAVHCHNDNKLLAYLRVGVSGDKHTDRRGKETKDALSPETVAEAMSDPTSLPCEEYDDDPSMGFDLFG